MGGLTLALRSLLLFLGVVAGSSLNCNEPIETAQGFVVGEETVSTNGGKFCSYRGIPYAQPPLGNLRFQPPKQIQNWTGIFNATKDGPMCAQKNYWFGDISYSEDCLYLNVYTPWVNMKNQTECGTGEKMPVIVYIHEGAFTAGEAGMRSKPPARLMNKPLVLVMIQYRLNVFGFFSTGDQAASGNYGMLDQVSALQWVQKNIAAFGGDPKRVTIMGQSAGGVSVTYHVASPKSRGLFRAAIAQSGAALTNWALQRNPIEWATRLGRALNCSLSNSIALVECLRYRPAKDIMDIFIQRWHDVTPFVPVIEYPTYGQFLTENPLKLYESGNVNNVPLMTGITKDDSAYILWGNTAFTTIDDAFFNITLPSFLNSITKYTTNLHNMSAAVRRTFFDTIDVTNSSQVNRTVMDVHSDVTFYTGTRMVVRLLANRNVPVYIYNFAHAGNVSMANFTGEINVQHEDDLYYLFNRTVLTERDEKFSDELIDMWFNFACKLNPTPRGFNGTKWSISGNGKRLKYLEIGEETNTMKEETDIVIDRVNFWQQIAPYTDDPNI